MKKQAIVWLVAAILCCGCFATSAVAQPEEILFRGIPWYTSEADVVKAVSVIKELGEPNVMQQLHPWEAFYYGKLFYVDNGGISLVANDFPVAGYLANLQLHFMYDIAQGSVNYELNDAQFYAAHYRIKNPPFFEEALSGIEDKLTELYGTPLTKEQVDAISLVQGLIGTVRMSQKGDILWCFGKEYGYDGNDRKTTIYLTYAAHDTNDRLLALKEQLLLEELNAEKERVADNYDGL